MKKNSGRINLLLKEYYAQSDDSAKENPYDLTKMEKLRTDALIAKSVESLRAYKEAESELRMLLFNNCDKLLDAVQVVVSIRTGSTNLVDLSTHLSQSGNRLDLITSRRNTNPETKQLESLIKLEKTVCAIEQILEMPKFLKSPTMSFDEKLKTYLRFRSKVFKSLSKYPLINRAALESLAVVESEIVPRINRTFENLKLLLELYPDQSSPNREAIISSYLETELTRIDKIEAESPEKNLETMKHLLELLFLGYELKNGDVYVVRIRDHLLPKSSHNILQSLEKDSAKMEGDFFADFVRAHMRIPGIDMQQVDAVIRAAIEQCIRCKFESGVAVSDQRQEGDLVHTQCCAVIVDVYEWISKVIDCLSELLVFKSEDFANPCVLSCIKAYYRLSLAGVDDALSVIKHVNNRRMFMRSMNAARDIFDLPIDDVADPGFILDCLFEELKRIGACIGSDVSCLETKLKEVQDTLSLWTCDRGDAGAASGSFGSRMVTAMTNSFTIRGAGKVQQKIKELEYEEMVHTRRVNIGRGSDVCREAKFFLFAFYLRTVKVKGEKCDEEKVRRLIGDEFLGEDATLVEMRHSLELMLKDSEGGSAN